MKQSTNKIIGIGGVFFKCDDPQAMNNWYRDVLGMEPNDYGILFEIKPFTGTPKYLQLGTFSNDSNYFEPSKKGFMINFRVDDLDAYLSDLKNRGVNTLGSVEVYEYGRFAHFLDLEGNKIELWEPIDSSFAEDEGATTPFI